MAADYRSEVEPAGRESAAPRRDQQVLTGFGAEDLHS